MKTKYALLALLVIIISLVGCTGQNAALPSTQGEVLVPASEVYNPSARNIDVPDLGSALAAAPHQATGLVQYTALSDTNQPDMATLAAIQIKEVGPVVTISLSSALPNLAMYLAYDSGKMHLESSLHNSEQLVGLTLEYAPGQIALGLIDPSGQPLPTETALATLVFAPGASTAGKHTSAAPQGARNKAEDLQVADNGNGSATLQWKEHNTGDYDLNGEVNISDLSPIGKYFQQTYTDSSSTFAQVEVVDGDANGEINIADLSPIGANFGSVIGGYNVYRIGLSSPDEVPDPEVGNWEKVENNTNPAGLSAPRDFNGQDFRLVYSFIDTSDNGLFGWYVAAADLGSDEGLPSDVVTLPVGGLFEGPWLQIVVQDPDDGNALAVDDEFWVGVVVHDVEGLFSANVRLEYDSQLIEYVEGQPAYVDIDSQEHPNLLVPPLFLSANDLAEPDRYKLLGFNATQTQGTPTKDGQGAVGYVKFKVLNTGGSPDAIRFPQSSSLIFLWGEQYGVPLVSPVGLAGPVTISVT